MTDIAETVDTYLTALTETDPAARANMVQAAWAEDGHFVDPLLEAQGHDAIQQLTDTVNAQYPDHRFHRTTGIDMHHGLIRFGWELQDPGNDIVAAGIDVGVVADDGRLARIAGFYGDPPARDGE